MFKACLDIVSRKAVGKTVNITESNEVLENISLVVDTERNIRYYVKEYLSARGAFDAILVVRDYEHGVIVRRYSGRMLGNKYGVVISNDTNFIV